MSIIGTRVILDASEGTVLARRGATATILRDDGSQVTGRVDELDKVIDRLDDQICAGMTAALGDHAYGRRRATSSDATPAIPKKAGKDLAKLFRKANGVKDLGQLLARETKFFAPSSESSPDMPQRYGRMLAMMALGTPYDGMTPTLVVPELRMSKAPDLITWRGTRPVRLQLRTRRPPRQRKR